MIASGTVLGAIAVPATVALLGFSTGGVVASESPNILLATLVALIYTTHPRLTGSIAAVIQSGIGNVATGSAFAIMQSVGTMPLLSGAIGATVGTAAGGTAAIITHKCQ
jgi:hypothetical protein